MNRRNFLRSIGVILAAPAIVRAEWIMPINSRLVVPANRILTPEMITRKALRMLERELTLATSARCSETNTGTEWHMVRGFIVGDTLRIRMPT